MSKKVDVVLIALSSPIMIGIYYENRLLETISSEDKSSSALPKIFDNLFKQYTLSNLFYANGPGSFMAIKISYIFLKSISIIKNIPLFGVDAFYFNNNKPIKAVGKLSFVKIAQEIKMQKVEVPNDGLFTMPGILKKENFNKNALPFYVIGVVL